MRLAATSVGIRNKIEFLGCRPPRLPFPAILEVSRKLATHDSILGSRDFPRCWRMNKWHVKMKACKGFKLTSDANPENGPPWVSTTSHQPLNRVAGTNVKTLVAVFQSPDGSRLPGAGRWAHPYGRRAMPCVDATFVMVTGVPPRVSCHHSHVNSESPRVRPPST